MKRLQRSVVDILSGNILLKLLGVVFTPLLVRALTKAEYGQFIGLLVIFQIVQRLSNVGLFQAVNKHTAARKQSEQSRVFISGLSLGAGYSVISAVVLYAVAAATQFELFSGVMVTYAAVVVVLLWNPFEVFRGYLYGIRQERIAQVLRLLRKGTYTVLGLGAAYAGLGVVGVFGGYAVSFLLGTTVALAVIYRRGWASVERAPDRDTVERVARYGAVAIVGYVSVLLLYRVDIVLIRFFVGDEATAGYQAALFSAELIWVIPGAIQGALLQDTASKWSDDGTEVVSETLQTSLIYAVAAVVLFGGGLMALAEDFLVVYFGPEYRDSVLPLRVLLLGAGFYGINRVYVPVLQAIGELRKQQATNVAALVLNVAANLLLIPQYGVLGAVVGTTVSYASVIVGSVLIIRRTPVNGPSTVLCGKLSALTLGFVVIFVIPISLINLPPLQSLAVFPPIGVVVFATLVYSLGLIDVGKSLETVARALTAWRE